MSASPWQVIPFPVTSFTDWQVLAYSVFLWTRRHCGPLMNLISLLCTLTSSFWRCETRSACYSHKPVHTQRCSLFCSEYFTFGKEIVLDLTAIHSSVMSWWFHHLKTLLQSHNDQRKSSLSCVWSSDYFPSSHLPMLSQLVKPKMQSHITVN